MGQNDVWRHQPAAAPSQVLAVSLMSEESGREPRRFSFTETGPQQPGDPLPASDNVVALSSRPAVDPYARLDYRLKWGERVCVLAFMAACLGIALVLWLYA